jgi:RimJ/RimL family protein N-acetyltransferase
VTDRLAGVSLSGRRIRLERLAARHLAALHGIAASPPVAPAWPLEGARVGLQEFGDYLWRRGSLHFAMARRDTGEAVGLVQGVDEDLRSGTIGLGLMVDPTLWQAGWPLEGVVLFLEYLFSGLGYRKVYCHMPASTVEKVGDGALDVFLTREATYTRHLKTDGGYEDLHILSLHRDDWDSPRARRITGNARR